MTQLAYWKGAYCYFVLPFFSFVFVLCFYCALALAWSESGPQLTRMRKGQTGSPCVGRLPPLPWILPQSALFCSLTNCLAIPYYFLKITLIPRYKTVINLLKNLFFAILYMKFLYIYIYLQFILKLKINSIWHLTYQVLVFENGGK